MDTNVGAANGFLDTPGALRTASGEEDSQPLTSLVPEQPGPYHDYMAEGEQAFQEGKYGQAYNKFLMANYTSPKDPASLISMTHCRFADGFYTIAAQRLRDAVVYFPELPLAPLSPRALYGSSSSKYYEQLFRLRNALDDNPNDPDGLFLLAYFQWFSGDIDEATQSLRQALRLEQDRLAEATDKLAKRNLEYRIEAIDIFWKAMVASGKVSGELVPASQPASKKKPSADKKNKANNTKPAPNESDKDM